MLGLPARIGFAGRPVLDLPKAQAAALQAVAQSLPAALCPKTPPRPALGTAQGAFLCFGAYTSRTKAW
ncbi:MAG TPA: hypothetical protein IAB43_02710 [Candidatus Spyradocola merdavium]|nr:hypothetical protein [Candidatus Spyradocola merdavium]